MFIFYCHSTEPIFVECNTTIGSPPGNVVAHGYLYKTKPYSRLNFTPLKLSNFSLRVGKSSNRLGKN